MVSFVQEKLGKSNLYSNTLSPAVPLISKVSFNLVSMSVSSIYFFQFTKGNLEFHIFSVSQTSV